MYKLVVVVAFFMFVKADAFMVHLLCISSVNAMLKEGGGGGGWWQRRRGGVREGMLCTCTCN